MVARNVTIAGRRTSLRIAPEMWDALQEAADRENHNLHELCTAISKRRGGHSMTAAIRVYLLTYFRAAATEAGHRAAGHGTLKRKPAS
jgi:predicted DNA-binding ribbon-helix-helix protein